MTAQTCTRCGAALRGGVCPNGHPQRVARRRRRGRRWGRALSLAILVILVAGSVYGAFAWYPRQVAGQAVGPTSRAFSDGLEAFQGMLAGYPVRPRRGAIEAGAEAILERADPTRQALGAGQGELVEHRLPSLPVIGTRPPLSIAAGVQDEMAFFYTGALEVVADLEGIARYLTQIDPTLPKLDNLREELGNPRTPGEIARAAAGARAVARQLIADLRAVTPPEEVGPIHAALLATAQAIRRDLDDIDRISRQGRSPVLRALIEDVESRIGSYRDTFTTAPGETMDAALEPAIAAVNRSVRRIVQNLTVLREEYGVTGLTVPRG
ncbi:MAG: hypothetical protein ACRDIX_05825 [Actinomycetota bacterium]